MTLPIRYRLVTAIYLNSRGFGFALFEGPLAPLDWGTVEVRGKEKRENHEELSFGTSGYFHVRPSLISIDRRLRTVSESFFACCREECEQQALGGQLA